MQSGRPESATIQGPAGSEVEWFELFCYPIIDQKSGDIAGVVEFLRDITQKKRDQAERQELREQLHQAQKMESVGRLAGGISHDFNNILSAINGYAEMCLMKMEKNSSVRRYVETILESGQRAARLTQQLLAFSRRQIVKPGQLDLNHELGQIQKMLHRLLGEDVELQFHFGENLWPIFFDRSQLEQVVLNLIVNARDAMPSGGRLSLATENYKPDGTKQQTEGVDLEEYVLLTITDTGKGMDEKTIDKIFEPFFTTKAQGEGTGLGLATVYGIMQQGKGEIQVTSTLGKGTSFKVFFPRCHVDAQAADQIPEKESTKIKAGSETILLVEDEEIVRKLSVKILTGLGYSVLEAANGVEALQIFKSMQQRSISC
jgi:signal transduction histidine kinase